MDILIETNAFKAFLYGILSCKCPVTRETEEKLFAIFFKAEHEAYADYFEILAVADKNPERTPIHNLFDFCIWPRDDLSSFTITINDVLRYLGSSFHYNMVTANNPGIEISNPALLISHLAIPVSYNNDDESALYQHGQAKINFEHIIFRNGLKADTGLYAIHMGVILCGISIKQGEMIYSHQSLIKGFREILRRVAAVDFKALAPYGNHYLHVIERFNRHY